MIPSTIHNGPVLIPVISTVQLDPVPPHHYLRLGPDNGVPGHWAHGHPHHESAHVPHLVRVTIVVVQHDNVPVPQLVRSEGAPDVPHHVVVVDDRVSVLLGAEVLSRVVYQVSVPHHCSPQCLHRSPLLTTTTGHCWPEARVEQWSGSSTPALTMVITDPGV